APAQADAQPPAAAPLRPAPDLQKLRVEIARLEMLVEAADRAPNRTPVQPGARNTDPDSHANGVVSIPRPALTSRRALCGGGALPAACPAPQCFSSKR